MIKKREVKRKTKKQDRENKQLLAVLVSIGVVLIITFTIYSLIQSSKSFDYYGVKFEKITYDKLPLYYSKVAVIRDDGSRINYNLYLRNDPRTNKVPVNTDIRFKRGLVYVTTDKGIGSCEDNSLALVNLGSFLRGIGIKAKGATSDVGIANETGFPLISCNNSSENTIISLETSEETGIEKKGDCYILKVKECNIIYVVEKFMVEIIKQGWISY